MKLQATIADMVRAVNDIRLGYWLVSIIYLSFNVLSVVFHLSI